MCRPIPWGILCVSQNSHQVFKDGSLWCWLWHLQVYIGRGNNTVCPVEALCNLLAVSGPSPGPLFCYTEGRLLTHQVLSSSVQSILHLAGLSGSYCGHSFRIAAARTAASPGLPDHLIKTLGWWFSDAYQCYIRTSAGSLIQVSGQLALQVQYDVCGLFCYWGWVPQVCPPPTPLTEAVAYWPQAPITPGWLIPE